MSMAEWRRPVRGYPNPHSVLGTSACRILGIIVAAFTLLFCVAPRAALAQGYDTYFVSGPLGELHVYKFSGPDGTLPYFGSLVYNPSDKSYYGTTYAGGASGLGTIFKFDPSSKHLTTLYSFTGPEGERPMGGLTVVNGAVYGTTTYGGSGTFAAGTLFK